MIQKVKNYILSHRVISVIIFIIIFIVCYFIFKNKTSSETQYVTEIVSFGSITTNVTGTGQVEASNTIDLKPRNTGDITYVGVKAGQNVKKGTLIASVDSRDARMALENAKISLAKLTKVDSLTLLKEENSLQESYDSGWNKVSSYISDTTLLLGEVLDIYSNDGYLGYKNTMGLFRDGKAKVSLGEDNYYEAEKSLEDLIKQYKTLSRSDSNEKIKVLITEAYESSVVVAKAVKDTEIAFNYVVDHNDTIDSTSDRTNINSWLSTSNNYVNNLLSIINGIKESEQSLLDTKVGADELDIRSAELSVESKQNAYNDCFLYAPFDGVVATLTAYVGASSGSSIGTLITKQKLATVTLNEVDIAKIKLGQKSTLTFDAIEDLSITGEVVEIDSIGTVSQGVVSYTVKISLDVNDDRIKPGMSVSVAIITNSVQGVIVIPSSAIKTQNNVSYVQTFNKTISFPEGRTQGSTSTNLPKKVEVIIGLVSDSESEIISGLKEGDIIVTKTVARTTTSKTTPSTKTPSILGAVGGMGPRN